MKNNKIYFTLLALFTAIPLGYLTLSWAKLPEKVPMHFDMDGNVNRYGSKWELAFLTLFLSSIILLLQLFVKIDPKKESIAANQPKYRMIFLAIAGFLAFIQVEIISTAISVGNAFNANLVLAGVGLLMAVLGNYMQNLKPNYFMGIRTPWTLNNEEVWRRTHLICGKWMFYYGLVTVVLMFLLPTSISFYIFTAGILLITVGAFYISYSIHKKVEKEGADLG